MSYILDALRRADRERSRGQLPDLLADGAPTATPGTEAGPGRRALPWVLTGLAVGLLVALVLRWAWPGAPEPVLAPAPMTAPMPAPMASPPPGPAPLAPTTPVAPATTAAAPAETTLLPPPRSTAQPPFMPAPPSPPPVTTTTRAAADLAAAAPAPPASAARAEPGAPAIVAFASLPEELRRALPQPRFTGAIHSPVAANRLVIVDGQLAREGDTVAPGLVLEQIRPRSVVLRHPLARYEIEL